MQKQVLLHGKWRSPGRSRLGVIRAGGARMPGKAQICRMKVKAQGLFFYILRVQFSGINCTQNTVQSLLLFIIFFNTSETPLPHQAITPGSPYFLSLWRVLFCFALLCCCCVVCGLYFCRFSCFGVCLTSYPG